MKNVSDKEHKYLGELINILIEPKIKKVVDEFNEFLKKKELVVGVELKWFFDKTGNLERKDSK